MKWYLACAICDLHWLCVMCRGIKHDIVPLRCCFVQAINARWDKEAAKHGVTKLDIALIDVVSLAEQLGYALCNYTTHIPEIHAECQSFQGDQG